MEESRTINTLRNIKTGVIVQIINRLMAFVVRTVFIKVLNTEYLGVNGLFTNVLTILSFAELGIGTAIIYNMYKPIADDEIEKIKSYMKLYKKAYTLIGCIVFVLGLLVIPFMNIIVKDIPNIKENIIFVYLLFLFNTASSYFFSYKKSIIIAYQKQSIIDNIDSLFYLIKSILEIIFLILTKKFIIYLLIQIIGTLIENIIISKKANQLYPFLKDKTCEELDNKEKKNIFKNVKSLVIYKFGVVAMTGTDNILISSLINVDTVGLCSNYTLIINAIKSVVFNIINAVTASIGNLNAGDDLRKKENIFYQFTFVNYIIYSFCAIAFIVLLNPFIELWLGKDYVLNMMVPVTMSFSFFIDGIRNPGYVYRTTLGLFEKAKMAPYIGAVSNIILSIIFCEKIGVEGIFLATAVSQLISYFWIDPYLIHKYEFKTSSKKYYKKALIYFIVFSTNVLICIVLTNLVKQKGVIGFVLKGIIVLIIANLVNMLFFRKNDEFFMIKERLIRLIKRGKNEK